MKRFKRICGAIGIIFVVLITSLTIWQRENIKATFNMVRYSKEELATNIEESKKVVEEAVKAYNIPIARDFTLEEEEQIRRGEITPEEAIKHLLKENTASSLDRSLEQDKAEQEGQVKEEVKEQGKEENQVEDIVATYTAQMYILKAQYLGLLGGVESSAIAQFKALPKEKRTMSEISKIVSSHVGQGTKLESQCDSEVSSLLNSLEAELQAIGGDTDIVQIMRSAYQSEKSAKKSYYLSYIKK